MRQSRQTERMRGVSVINASRLVRVAAIVMGGVLVVAALASVASAAPKVVIAVFGQSGSGPGEFSAPAGVAVNQATGDVYVVDSGNDRVQRFDSDGTLLSQFGTMGAGNGEFNFGFQSAGLAVASDGSVYVADTGNNRIQVFTAAGAYVSQFGAAGSGDGQFAGPISVAIDTTAADDVLVADRDNGRIQRFSSAGVYESQFSGTGDTQFFGPQRVAVNGAGDIYVLEPFNRVLKFDSAGASGQVLAPDRLTNLPQELAASGGIALVAQFSSDFSAIDLLEFDATDLLVETHFAPGSGPSGLALRSATGRLYLADNIGNRVFILDAPTHTATIGAATDVVARSATLNGTVDPNGDLAARYHFEYSRDDGVTWTSVPTTDVDIGAGTDAIPVSQEVTGLEPSTDYRARLVATTEFGSTVTSDETTFTTLGAPPDVTTLPTAQRGATTARIVGDVDPNNEPTSYFFEYGETDAYGAVAPVPAASAGSGGVTRTVVEEIGGLRPNTTYHYRLVASNASGPAEGEDRAFTTRAADSAPGGRQDRGYELVSPAYKVGGVGVAGWYRGPGGLQYSGVAAYEKERFAVAGHLGSVLLDGAQAYASDWAFAERVDDAVGWRSRSPITHNAFARAYAQFLNLPAASPDLSTVVWRSNNSTLKVFPELATWPQDWDASFAGDWEGRWELFGPTDLGQVDADAAVGGQPQLWDAVPSADGSHIVASSRLTDTGRSAVTGLGGPGDPTGSAWGDLVSGRAVYLADLSDGLADKFAPESRELVNLCSGGTLVPSVDVGGDLQAQSCPGGSLDGRDGHLVSNRGAAIQASNVVSTDVTTSMENVISEDGARVFFMSPDPLSVFGVTDVPNGTDSFCTGTAESTLCPTQLFVRQRNRDGSVTTRWISRAVDGLFGTQDASLTGTVRFEGASRDGDRVFFRTNSPLTSDDPNGAGSAPAGGVTDGVASNQSWDLYMYDLPDGPDGDPSTPDADPAGGELTRISSGPDAGDCNVTPGDVDRSTALRFVSRDGSRAYFTCAAPLSGADGTPTGGLTEPGGSVSTLDTANLYSVTLAGAQASWQFVARLPRPADGVTGSGGGLAACATTGANRRTPLSGGSGGGVEIATTTTATNCVRGASDGSFITFWTAGRLTGDDPAAPDTADIYAYDAHANELTRVTAPQGGDGDSYTCGTNPGNEASTTQCFGDNGFDQPDTRERVPLPSLGLATDPLRPGDRTVFFQSRSALVAADQDDGYDVYEWHNGVLDLVTSGAPQSDDAIYKGNDRSGRNVYFATRDNLTWQDVDRVADVYTARVGGGIPQPGPASICPALTGTCQGSGGRPDRPTVSSDDVGGGQFSPGRRPALRVRRPSARARRAAARSGVLRLRVLSNVTARVKATGRTPIGGRMRVVARGSTRVRPRRAAVLSLRLSRDARHRLRRNGAVVLNVDVTMSRAHARHLTIRLAGGRR